MKTVRFGIIGSNFIVDRFMEAARLCSNVEIKAIYSIVLVDLHNRVQVIFVVPVASVLVFHLDHYYVSAI